MLDKINTFIRHSASPCIPPIALSSFTPHLVLLTAYNMTAWLAAFTLPHSPNLACLLPLVAALLLLPTFYIPGAAGTILTDLWLFLVARALVAAALYKDPQWRSRNSEPAQFRFACLVSIWDLRLHTTAADGPAVGTLSNRGHLALTRDDAHPNEAAASRRERRPHRNYRRATAFHLIIATTTILAVGHLPTFRHSIHSLHYPSPDAIPPELLATCKALYAAGAHFTSILPTHIDSPLYYLLRWTIAATSTFHFLELSCLVTELLTLSACGRLPTLPLSNAPFSATSVQDFWLRWNCLFQASLREMLHRPVLHLTGSRQAGVMATFFASGIWHAFLTSSWLEAEAEERWMVGGLQAAFFGLMPFLMAFERGVLGLGGTKPVVAEFGGPAKRHEDDGFGQAKDSACLQKGVTGISVGDGRGSDEEVGGLVEVRNAPACLMATAGHQESGEKGVKDVDGGSVRASDGRRATVSGAAEQQCRQHMKARVWPRVWTVMVMALVSPLFLESFARVMAFQSGVMGRQVRSLVEVVSCLVGTGE